MDKLPLSQAHKQPGYQYYISLWLPAALVGVMVVLVLIFQVVLSWRVHTELAPVNSHINQMTRQQAVSLELQSELIDSLSDDKAFTSEKRHRMRDELEAIRSMRAHLSEETPQALARARAVLADASVHPRDALILALSYLRKSLSQESLSHQRLIDEATHAITLELEIGSITLLAFPAVTILLIYLLRRRILSPIHHLGYLMTLLSRKRFTPATLHKVDPMLRPLTENFNAMVSRLAELEQEHEMREQDLQGQIDNATKTLLEQQRNLANTERLAAVGETSARIAHELRNPLAGVKMACTNLSEELKQKFDSVEYNDRFNIMASEIDRVIALLNSLLDQSKHRPETVREVNLANTVEALITLMRYQIPKTIRLEQHIDSDICCYLPEALFRQALLNLLLNSWRAIGEKSGTIIIEVSQADGHIQLDIQDDGSGFPDDLIEHGVQAFVSHRDGGTGLGLSMVQRFARSLGGSLNLSNRETGGACVTLNLPCGKPDNV